MPRPMNAVLIVNDRAGSLASGDAEAPTMIRLHDAFASAGVDVALHSCSGPEVDGLVREAIATRPDAVFVGGGDGTISAAAAALVDGDIPLGVLPLGTLNHFARDLGIPQPWAEAVRALAAGSVRRVDVGEVNGRIFLNNCSLGSYAEAVRRRDALRRQLGHRKWTAMLRASLSVVRNLRRLHLRVHAPGSSRRARTLFLLVANNRYSGRVLDTALRPQLDSGQLWIYTTRAKGHLRLLRMVWQTLFRELDAADDLDVQPVDEAVVTIERGSLVGAADGELVPLEPPLRFRIRPRALPVLSPSSPAP